MESKLLKHADRYITINIQYTWQLEIMNQVWTVINYKPFVTKIKKIKLWYKMARAQLRIGGAWCMHCMWPLPQQPPFCLPYLLSLAPNFFTPTCFRHRRHIPCSPGLGGVMMWGGSLHPPAHSHLARLLLKGTASHPHPSPTFTGNF